LANRQTDRHTKNRHGAGSANSGAYHIPVHTPDAALLTLFSLLIYIFCGRGLKGRAGCRQTEVQTDRQSLGPMPRIGDQIIIIIIIIIINHSTIGMLEVKHENHKTNAKRFKNNDGSQRLMYL